MDAFLGELIERVSAADPCWAYTVLLVSAILENVVPPVPGDTVVVLSAYLVGRGVLGAVPVYLATCIGGTAGFMIMYAVGLFKGRAFLERRRGQLFSSAHIARAESWLARRGLLLILGNRFLGGIRTVVALSAGMGRMDWRLVALGAAASMALWNGLLLYAGVLLGRNWGSVLTILETYNQGVLVLMAVAALIWLARRASRRRPANTES